MNEDEKSLFREFVNSMKMQNERISKLMLMVSIVFALTVTTFAMAITTICISYNNAEVEKTRLYFETDYSDYIPSVTQTNDMKVGE